MSVKILSHDVPGMHSQTRGPLRVDVQRKQPLLGMELTQGIGEDRGRGGETVSQEREWTENQLKE